MESVNNNNASVVAEDIQPERPAELVESERSAVSPDGPNVAELTAERDRLLREKAELQDLLQRRQAEFENYRKRVERERSELLEFAAMDTIKALLPILDDFERALKVETLDKEYARGIEMIYKRLWEVLKKMGVEPITNDVPLFNPHIHNAVEMVDTKDHPDQTILEEYQRGYYFKGKLLRAAMVKVASNE